MTLGRKRNKTTIDYPIGSALPLDVVYALYRQGFRFDDNDDEDGIIAALEGQGVPNARQALNAYLEEPSEIDLIVAMEKLAAEYGSIDDAPMFFYRK